MAEFEEPDGIGHPLRLFQVRRGGASCGHRTVMTTPGAHVPKNEKCGRPIIPTLPYIRTSSFFTNGMQAMGIHQLTDFLVMRAWSEADFKPGRKVFSAKGPCGRRSRSDF
jgi:hypothetical protein